jgi:hypothetical protein
MDALLVLQIDGPHHNLALLLDSEGRSGEAGKHNVAAH